MKQETRVLWSWIAAIACTVALAVGAQSKTLAPSDQATISDYFTARGADELSPFK